MDSRSKYRLSIPGIVLIGMFSLATLSTAVLGLFWIRSEVITYREMVAHTRDDYINAKRRMLQFQIDSVIEYILYMKSLDEDRLKKEIKDRVYEAHALAQNIVTKFQSHVDRETLEALVREALREIRFHNGQGYYFAFRMDGIETLFAERPELEGTNMMGIKDTEGRSVVPDMLEIAKSEGEGYYPYRWIRPGMEGADYKKISFVKYFEPLDWVIGTGIYVDDVTEATQKEVIARIDSIELPNNEYIFVGTWEGFVLTGPGTGEVMIDIEDINGLKVVQELINTAKKGGGFVQYVMPDVDGQRVATKLSYTRSVPDWEWYVGTGVYIDELESAIAVIEQQHVSIIQNTVIKIITILLILLVLSLAAAYGTSTMVRNGVKTITSYFEQASGSSTPPPTPSVVMPEFIQLADAANRILIDRLRAEDERRKLEEQVQNTQRLESLGILAGGIAHDFNNLLQAIIGNAELAKPELPDNPMVIQNVEAIEAASHRAAELCQQLLTYSGQGSFKRERTNLQNLVEEMSHMIAISIPKKIEVIYQFSEENTFVDADPGQLSQVVLNLITNAAEAIGENTGTITLGLQKRHLAEEHISKDSYPPDVLEEGDYLELSVTDNGVGMDEETLKRMFDPFFTTKFTGRGLGLAAVLGIAKRHSGAVRVESDPGKGTTFYFLLPAANGVVPTEGPERIEAVREGVRGTILVVDDERAVQLVASRMLEKAGFDVMSAFDGREALDIIEGHHHRLGCVLMDMMMPEMDGIEALTAIHEIAPTLPIILTSGFDERNFLAKLPDHPLAGFIQKPFRMEELTRIVEKAMLTK